MLHFWRICKICTIYRICIIFEYYIKPNILYLLRLEDAVNANITLVQRDGRQAQRYVLCIMVLVHKSCNLVRKHRQNSILAEFTSIFMQHRVPSNLKLMVTWTTVVISSTSQLVWIVEPLRDSKCLCEHQKSLRWLFLDQNLGQLGTNDPPWEGHCRLSLNQ